MARWSSVSLPLSRGGGFANRLSAAVPARPVARAGTAAANGAMISKNIPLFGEYSFFIQFL